MIHGISTVITQVGLSNNNNDPEPSTGTSHVSSIESNESQRGIKWEHITIALTIIFATASATLIGAAVVFAAEPLFVAGLAVALLAIVTIGAGIASERRGRVVFAYRPDRTWYITNPFVFRRDWRVVFSPRGRQGFTVRRGVLGRRENRGYHPPPRNIFRRPAVPPSFRERYGSRRR